ncbi:MAG: hypothetical protein SVX38_09530 [Chloroflexota bacterium]|nr:hypothetical protein [Chloroflexota bacterium]
MRKSRRGMNQAILWALSALVILSMICGLVVTVMPPSLEPTATPTLRTLTPTPFRPSPTPTNTSAPPPTPVITLAPPPPGTTTPE